MYTHDAFLTLFEASYRKRFFKISLPLYCLCTAAIRRAADGGFSMLFLPLNHRNPLHPRHSNALNTNRRTRLTPYSASLQKTEKNARSGRFPATPVTLIAYTSTPVYTTSNPPKPLLPSAFSHLFPSKPVPSHSSQIIHVVTAATRNRRWTTSSMPPDACRAFPTAR